MYGSLLERSSDSTVHLSKITGTNEQYNAGQITTEGSRWVERRGSRLTTSTIKSMAAICHDALTMGETMRETMTGESGKQRKREDHKCGRLSLNRRSKKQMPDRLQCGE